MHWYGYPEYWYLSGLEADTRVGDRVRFSLTDVFLPDPEEVTEALSSPAELKGRIVGFSDSGEQTAAFAVVEIIRRLTVVVPVKPLRLEADEHSERT